MKALISNSVGLNHKLWTARNDVMFMHALFLSCFNSNLINSYALWTEIFLTTTPEKLPLYKNINAQMDVA